MNPKHPATFATTLFLALFLSMSSHARAAENAQPSQDDGLRGLRGLELTLRGSPGGASAASPVQLKPDARVAGDPGALLKGSASPYGIGFVGQAMIGYRIHPIASFGLRGGLRTSSSSGIDDGSTNLTRSSWDAGFYVRAYPLALTPSVRNTFEPWVSVGVEYMRDTQSFRHPALTTTGSTITSDVTLDHHAVAIPMAIGVDYRLHPRVALGPSFEYAIAVPVAGCASQNAAGYSGVEYCTNGDSGAKVLAANGYGVWSAGLDLRVTLF
jgi:hypothetical protein